MTSPTGYMSIADGQCSLLITVIQAFRRMEQLSAVTWIHNVGRIDCSEGLVATTPSWKVTHHFCFQLIGPHWSFDLSEPQVAKCALP